MFTKDVRKFLGRSLIKCKKKTILTMAGGSLHGLPVPQRTELSEIHGPT